MSATRLGYYEYWQHHSGPIDFASLCVPMEAPVFCCTCGATLKDRSFRRCDRCMDEVQAIYGGRRKSERSKGFKPKGIKTL